MFSDRLKSQVAALALAGAALALPVAAMAGVVVKSTGPSSNKYPVGTKVDDNASITLKAGDVVTVLTGDGTRVIKGAGTFRVGDRPQVASDRFASLTRKRAATRVRTGAVRGESEDTVTKPSRWYVDVTRSGTICLYDLATVRLWRPGTGTIQTYSVAAHDGGTPVEVDLTPFLDAAKLLYDGPWVAERYVAIQDFINAQPEAVFPPVRTIIEGGRNKTAAEAFAGLGCPIFPPYV